MVLHLFNSIENATTVQDIFLEQIKKRNCRKIHFRNTVLHLFNNIQFNMYSILFIFHTLIKMISLQIHCNLSSSKTITLLKGICHNAVNESMASNGISLIMLYTIDGSINIMYEHRCHRINESSTFVYHPWMLRGVDFINYVVFLRAVLNYTIHCTYMCKYRV